MYSIGSKCGLSLMVSHSQNREVLGKDQNRLLEEALYTKQKVGHVQDG